METLKEKIDKGGIPPLGTYMLENKAVGLVPVRVPSGKEKRRLRRRQERLKHKKK